MNGNFFSKDVRISALVSLIKSAHLTLFEILGYRYALSTGGYFIGHDILGKFYLKIKCAVKSDVFKNAFLFFQEFAHMVRPIQDYDIAKDGTIIDQIVFVCLGKYNQPWALIVFIRVSQTMQAVLIPIFDNAEMVETDLSFL